MPLPKPIKGEEQSGFIARFMKSEVTQKEFPDEKQRQAVAFSVWEESQYKKDSLTRNINIRLDFKKQDALHTTPEGYLIVDGFLTCAGVFDYYDEKGHLTRELRPGEEVFDFESLKTLQLQPVTNLHPGEMVTPGNIKDYQIGVTGEAIKREKNKDGDFVKMKIKLIDPAVIEQVKKRRDAGLSVELSCGYEAEVIPISGRWQNEHYDAIQTRIRYNHVSLVPAGRAGEHVRLRFDKSQKHKLEVVTVKFKKKAIKLDTFAMDDINVEVPDEAMPTIDRLSEKLDEATEVIQSQGKKLDETTQKLTEAQAKVDELKDSKKKIDALQAKLDQTTDELKKAKEDVKELSCMESPRVQAMLRAKTVLEQTADKLKVDRKDKDPRTIRIDCIKAVSPSFDPEGKSDDYINARYDSVIEFVEQAENNANNSALGQFISQAKQDSSPKDPRAEFIRKSQELGKGGND